MKTTAEMTDRGWIVVSELPSGHRTATFLTRREAPDEAAALYAVRFTHDLWAKAVSEEAP